MTWKKKIAGTAAMFILGFIFILPVLWIVMNSIKTSPEIAADFLALPKSYDSYFCTCYKYQSYQFPWRNYHS